MKKQAIYLFLAYALCSATSCKKDSSSSSSNSGLLGMVKSLSEKITSTVTGNRYTKVNFNYDSQGRLSSMIDSSNSGNKELYNYPTSNGFTLDIYEYNMLQIHYSNTFDSKKNILSTYQYNNTKDTTWDTFNYTFNTKNQITTASDFEKWVDSLGIKDSTNTVTNYTYDANGNVITETDNQGSTSSYTYYTTTYTAPTNIFPNQPFLGNLVKSKTTSYGGSPIIVNYTYTFDSMNRVSTKTAISDAGSTTIITTYTYY